MSLSFSVWLLKFWKQIKACLEYALEHDNRIWLKQTWKITAGKHKVVVQTQLLCNHQLGHSKVMVNKTVNFEIHLEYSAAALIHKNHLHYI